MPLKQRESCQLSSKQMKGVGLKLNSITVISPDYGKNSFQMQLKDLNDSV